MRHVDLNIPTRLEARLAVLAKRAENLEPVQKLALVVEEKIRAAITAGELHAWGFGHLPFEVRAALGAKGYKPENCTQYGEPAWIVPLA